MRVSFSLRKNGFTSAGSGEVLGVHVARLRDRKDML